MTTNTSQKSRLHQSMGLGFDYVYHRFLGVVGSCFNLFVEVLLKAVPLKFVGANFIEGHCSFSLSKGLLSRYEDKPVELQSVAELVESYENEPVALLSVAKFPDLSRGCFNLEIGFPRQLVVVSTRR